MGQSAFIEQLLGTNSDHAFAESFSQLLNRSIVGSEELGDTLDATPAPAAFTSTSTRIARQLKLVASVILARARTGNEREVFYVDSHGYDSHFQFLKPGTTVYDRLAGVDDAIKMFETEMKSAGLWDDVLVLSVSDFGRKLVPNGGGTDHAWGGHYFFAGGSVKGGQILGRYPSRLDETSEQNIYNSGGRFIPTTSWEAVWSPIAEWFGVDPSKMAHVLPNLQNFPSGHAIPKDSMFDD